MLTSHEQMWLLPEHLERQWDSRFHLRQLVKKLNYLYKLRLLDRTISLA